MTAFCSRPVSDRIIIKKADEACDVDSKMTLNEELKQSLLQAETARSSGDLRTAAVSYKRCSEILFQHADMRDSKICLATAQFFALSGECFLVAQEYTAAYGVFCISEDLHSRDCIQFDPDAQIHLASLKINQGLFERLSRKLEASLILFECAVSIAEKFLGKPTAEAEIVLVKAFINLGNSQDDLGAPRDALQSYESASRILNLSILEDRDELIMSNANLKSKRPACLTCRFVEV